MQVLPSVQAGRLLGGHLGGEEQEREDSPGGPDAAGWGVPELCFFLFIVHRAFYFFFQVEDLEEGDRHSLYLTGFDIYDERGHLVDLTSGLVEDGELVFFTGTVKPVCARDPDDPGSEGRTVIKGGRITCWWFTGHKEGDTPTIGISTGLAGRVESLLPSGGSYYHHGFFFFLLFLQIIISVSRPRGTGASLRPYERRQY